MYVTYLCLRLAVIHHTPPATTPHSSIRSVRGTSIVGVNVLQLTPSTTYNCSVAASNSFGQGEYSPVVQGTTLASTSELTNHVIASVCGCRYL